MARNFIDSDHREFHVNLLDGLTAAQIIHQSLDAYPYSVARGWVNSLRVAIPHTITSKETHELVVMRFNDDSVLTIRINDIEKSVKMVAAQVCILSQLNLLARIYDWYYSVGYRYQDDTRTIILLEEQNMLDADIVGKLVNDISYELDLEYFGKSHGNVINITKLKDWYDTQEISHKKTFEEAPAIYSEAIAMLAELKNIIDEEEAKPIIGLATSELREFYGEFMSGKLHPKLRHHQQQRQRLMLEDSELCDASGITHLDLADAARSRRFIDLMIMKYKPADMSELRSLFSSDSIAFINA